MCACACRLAAADWVITSPTRVGKESDLYKAITWRRVIADEIHQLTGPAPGATGNAADKQLCYMRLLAKIPVAVSRWCLSGTPLRDLTKPEGMDRIWTFLQCGFKTYDLSPLQFAAMFSKAAIRYTRDGHYQVQLRIWTLHAQALFGLVDGQRRCRHIVSRAQIRIGRPTKRPVLQGVPCLALPSVTEEVVKVELNEGDDHFTTRCAALCFRGHAAGLCTYKRVHVRREHTCALSCTCMSR